MDTPLPSQTLSQGYIYISFLRKLLFSFKTLKHLHSWIKYRLRFQGRWPQVCRQGGSAVPALQASTSTLLNFCYKNIWTTICTWSTLFAFTSPIIIITVNHPRHLNYQSSSPSPSTSSGHFSIFFQKLRWRAPIMKVIQEGRMAGWYFDLRGVQICWGLAQHRLVEISFLRTINF